MKQIVLISALMIFSLASFAQHGHGHNHAERYKKIQKKKVDFLKKELQLTTQEEESFLKSYAKYEKERGKLHSERHKLMKNYKINGLNMSEKELLSTADRFVDIEVELAQLGKTYNEKFKNELPAVKLLLLHQAEHKFKVKMLKNMKKHHKRGGNDK